MDERFFDEFVTWRHKTPVGVQVDEVFGMEEKSGRTWIELAKQIYCEQGEPNYRIIDHFGNGAPFIEGYSGRISITHTKHFFAVASLPKTPEVKLDSFNPRSAMGIDAETLDRIQVLKVRSKFLSEEEITLIPSDNLDANLIAWTCKEALYKAAFTVGLDFKNDIKITRLPSLVDNPLHLFGDVIGEGRVNFPEELDIESHPFKLFSYKSYGCCISIAVSPKAAKYSK